LLPDSPEGIARPWFWVERLAPDEAVLSIAAEVWREGKDQ
jgi:hypothetical protein